MFILFSIYKIVYSWYNYDGDFMDGNRGAKGSIKDRLISMLYRLRYKKKILKEENYTVDNKIKQQDYLYMLYFHQAYQ